MIDTIGSVCCKEECINTEYTCCCKDCESEEK
jgi:hypothetical protein